MQDQMKSFRRFNLITLGFTLLVIVWGAYVRATGSGAGCGDHWPLCNGEVIPRSETLKTVIEFTHRLTSGLNLILVVVAYLWSKRIAPPGCWIRKSSFLALVSILLEALLGAGLVLLKLVEFDQSVARAVSISLHLVNTLFLLTTISTLTWFSYFPEKGLMPSQKWIYRDRTFLTCFGVFLILGMSGAITALGDTLFPAQTLMEGVRQDLNRDAHFLVRLRVFHPLIAMIWIGLAFGWSRRFESVETLWVRGLLISGLTIQFILGILNWVLMAPNWLQLVHLLMADLVFILFWLSSHVDRDRKVLVSG